MNIVQITPGAGGMYCGNCFRDNALVAALRRQGHTVLMVPLYLPVSLDETDQSTGTPTFFGGINVYLDQKLPWYRRAPQWLRRWLDAPAVLRWAAGRTAKTRANDLGDLTLSMLRGEEGNQLRELDELVNWLKSQPQRPDVICLSNALLAGMVRRLRHDLDAAVVCTLQGEDSFLDGLPPRLREPAWRSLAERAAEADMFIAPSRYYADRMRERLNLPAAKVRVVWNGVSLEGYAPSAGSEPAPTGATLPTLGFFARICREKGLDLLVDAFIEIKKGARVPRLKLRVGGNCGPADEGFLSEVRRKLQDAGCGSDVDFVLNPDREAKLAFYRSLTVFSVPALYGEAFGLYLVEAMAAGVPVVQPRHAAFPEIVEASGAGVLCEPNAKALAAGLERLLLDPARLRQCASAGIAAARSLFGLDRMAEKILAACEEALTNRRRN